MDNKGDRVLLIDDDKEIVQINAKYLQNAGYSVAVATEPQKVLEYIDKFHPQCIVSDVMMPNVDGFTLCAMVREKHSIPIILLTGKTSEDDKVEGLLCGADDYMVKPYSLRELEARIRINVRRYKKEENKTDSMLDYYPLKIDIALHKVFYKEEEILLSNREYELLYYLAVNKGKVITFEEIGEKIWGVYSENDRRSIMVNASRLRKRLESYPELANVIETVWGQGYLFRGVQ